jgi:uncharacterized repeat protein (TIGR03803 family)
MARPTFAPCRSRFAAVGVACALALGSAPGAADLFESLHSFDPEKGSPVAGLVEIAPGTFVGTAQTGGELGWGSVFRIAFDGAGWTFENLHSFAGPDGATPQGALLAASDGALYGTTYTGGASGVGIVFSGALYRIDGAGTFTLLHSFTGLDGARPMAGLIEASDGFFYGTTWGGGAAGVGTLFRTDATGAVNVLHSFSGADGARPAAALVEATDGRLYGTTTAGGANGLGALFRIEPGGAGFTLLRSLAPGDGSAPYAALIEDAGLLYGVASAGGASGGGTVFSFAVGATERPAARAATERSGAHVPFARERDEVALTVVHDFAPADGTGAYAALVAGPGGSFYGTTRAGGAFGGGTAFRLDAGGAFLVLRSFAAPEGTSPHAPLAAGLDGRLYGAARAGGPLGHGTLFALDPGGALETLHTFGRELADGAAPAAPLAPASDGLLYGTTTAGGASNLGTAFQLDPASGALTALHSFVASEGTRPWGGLAETPWGTFLGTAQMGGTYGTGSVFEMTPAGAVTPRHAFLFAEGTSPVAGLVLAGDGLFYGTTPMAGPGHAGTVYRVDAAGALDVVHAFDREDGRAPRAPLVEAAGVLYGSASAGGSGEAGTLFEVRSGLTVLHAFAGGDGAVPLAGLLPAADGLLYGTTAAGGDFDLGTVFRTDPTGQVDVLHSFTGPDGARPTGGLAVGADGALYGTTESGGAADLGVVFRLVPGFAPTLVHEFGGADGASPRAALALAADGALYGTTFAGGARGAGTVFRVHPLRVEIVPGGPTTFCAPGGVVLDALASGGSGIYTSYQWYRDGLALPGATGASLDASTSGSYTVTVTDSTGLTSLPSASVTVVAEVVPTPVVVLVSGANPSCPGDPVTLDAGTGYAGYLWSTGATTRTVSVAPPATATFTVVGTSANGCASAPGSWLQTVHVPATARVGGGGLISAGNSIDVTASLTGTPPWSLTWSDGITQTGVGVSPAVHTVSPPATTTYSVTAVAGADGCPGSATGSATVTVTSVRLSFVLVLPAIVDGGTITVNNFLFLSGAAPAPGALVMLTSSHPAIASVPSSVLIPAGQTFRRFTITTFPPPAQTTVTITASWAGTTLSDTLVVRVP